MGQIKINNGIPITNENLSFVEAMNPNNSATLLADDNTVNLAGKFKGAVSKITGINGFRHDIGTPDILDPTKFNFNDMYDPMFGVADIYTKPTIAIWNHYRKIVDIMIEKFNWTGIPGDETGKGLNHFVLEKKLLTQGSVAIIKEGDEFWAVGFTVNARDLNDNPTEIKVVEPGTMFNDKIYKDKFVVIKNQHSGLSLFQRLIRLLADYENASYALSYRLKWDGTFHLIVNENNTGQNSSVAQSFENSILSNHKVLEASGDFSRMGNWSELIHTLDNGVLQDVVAETKARIREEIKEELGLEVSVINKGDRLITPEIGNQQGISDHIEKAMLSSRKFGCKLINEKFKNVNWNVSLWESENENLAEGVVDDDQTEIV